MPAPQRATFDAEELAVVLSHFDLGVIESVTEFARGSRRSPKIGIVADKGKFVLKRRSGRRAHADRVRFAHHVQARLQAVGFPMARIIPTRVRGDTFVQIKEDLYELFEFVPGHPYHQSAAESQDAGLVLAKFHVATEHINAPRYLPVPQGDYHDAAGVRTGLCQIGAALSSSDSFAGTEAELAGLSQFLLESYDHAVAVVNGLGFNGWPPRVIHSDWHPGNLLFRNDKVIAVIDYDSVRLSRRVADTANGCLHFSILAGGDPATWPAELDEERYRAFRSGYESVLGLSDEERRALPHLMAEALIAECVPPISETGSVGRWSGYRVLQMVRRKLFWLAEHGDRLTRLDP